MMAISAPLVFTKLLPDNHVLPFLVPGYYTVNFEAAGSHLIYQEFEASRGPMQKKIEEEAFSALKIEIFHSGQKTKPCLLEKSSSKTNYTAGARRGFSRYEFFISEPGNYKLMAYYPKNTGPNLILSIGRKSLGNKIARISIVILIVVVNLFLLTTTAALVFGWLKKK